MTGSKSSNEKLLRRHLNRYLIRTIINDRLIQKGKIMFSADDNFLEEVGLSGLPEAEKQPFLDYIDQELAERVGSKLTAKLSIEQMDEFEAVTNGDESFINQWLSKNMGEYKSTEDFKLFVELRSANPDDLKTKVEYASMKWFEKNLPNNQEVVVQEINKIKSEIRTNRDAILGA